MPRMHWRLVSPWLAIMACLWGCLPRAQAQSGRLPTINVSGRDYVRVTDAARAYQMGVSAEGRFVSMTSQYATVRLELDSREASLNGAKVWLGSPPAFVRGATVITRSDLSKVIEPVLFPPNNGTPAVFRAIVIDPGHGGAD